MSDDLTPAEQARAARWAADWLIGAGFNTGAGVFVVRALFDHVDSLDPPETVESLRAEQDKVVAQFEMVLVERNKAREDVGYWREQFRRVCDESEDRKRQVAAVTAERDNAIYNADEADRWKERFAGEQEELVQALNKLSAANYTIARLRSTHVEAEAAWERCRHE